MTEKEPRNGKLLYGIFENTCVIKAVGSITYRVGISFDTFISRIIADNTIEDFLIDLSEADYIDSTNLGLLARIQVYSKDRFSRQPTLISASDTINSILAALGFDRLFTIVDASSPRFSKMTEVPSDKAEQPRMEDVLLSAHKYLMNTNSRNALVFKDIVEMLERDSKQRRTPN